MNPAEEANEAAQTLTRLGQIAANLQPRAELLISEPRKGVYEPKRLNATRDLRLRFHDANSDNARFLASLTPIEYLPGRAMPDGHIMWTQTSSVPLLNAISVEDGDGGDQIPSVNPRQFDVKRLRLTITTAKERTGKDPLTAVYYRVTSDSALLSRTGKIAALLGRDIVDTIDDDVLLFNNRVDAVSVGDFTYFTNTHTFTRAFKFIEALQAAAQTTFDTAIAGLNIEGLPELRRVATSDFNMMSKMSNVQKKMDSIPAYRNAMKMENLLRFIDENPHIKIETVGTGPNRRFVFSNATGKRYQILKLLDDDHLASHLTQLNYTVDSKSDPVV